MKRYTYLFLKGLAMGAANVIPGVSGGTIALITGIYETLINSLKSFDLKAIKLLFQFKLEEFWNHINGSFLVAVLAGVGVSIFSLAKLLEFLLNNYEVYTMAFFFGLILISVYVVGRTIMKWSAVTITAFIVGTAIAAGIAFMAPATENASFFYVFICGIVAVCSMILPGLSGSFILIIMGNYALILGAIGSVNLGILFPMLVGCAAGLIAFSQLLAWVYKHYRDATIALMTGFIMGSLLIIWPWKNTLKEFKEIPGKAPKEVVVGYDWFIPDFSLTETWIAFVLILVGIAVLWGIERAAVSQ